jgi:hypothetical protein
MINPIMVPLHGTTGCHTSLQPFAPAGQMGFDFAKKAAEAAAHDDAIVNCERFAERHQEPCHGQS